LAKAAFSEVVVHTQQGVSIYL